MSSSKWSLRCCTRSIDRCFHQLLMLEVKVAMPLTKDFAGLERVAR
jgi:hypothetical protein